MQKLIVVVSFLLGLISAFPTKASNIEITNAYVRESIPGNNITSAYMTITNNSAQAVKLIGAQSPISDRIEIHNHIMDDGMMKMRQMESIDIDKNQTVHLQPMGLHLMLFDIKNQLKSGDFVSITLTFKDSSSQTLNIPIKKMLKRQQHHHH